MLNVGKINSNLMISEIGEKKLVQYLTNLLDKDNRLLYGFGHDSAFLDITCSEDEVLLMNTDRSSSNLAYSLKLANGECVGDFAVSHGISDIIASGGTPITISVALLLPDFIKLKFLTEVMIGIQKAAKKYGAFVSCGDTKKNPKFCIVITAIGKCKKNSILTRSGAKEKNLIVVTGYLGTMISAIMFHKNKLILPKQTQRMFNNSIIYQNPPYKLARKIIDAQLANACMDNSDGLSSTIYSLCEKSNLGAIIYKDKVPILDESISVANTLGIDYFEFALASGDWQYIYSVPEENIEKFLQIAKDNNSKATVIGEFIKDSRILLKDDNLYYMFNKIENDRFLKTGAKYFRKEYSKLNYYGDKVCL